MENGALPKSGVKYWIILLLVIIVQIIFAWNTVENDRKSKVTEIENSAKEDIQYLHGMIRDKLQNKEYDSGRKATCVWASS